MDLNAKHKTIKLQEKKGENCQSLGVGKESLDLKIKAPVIREKTDKIIKVKNSCSVNNPVKRMQI